jgi:exodeoxyribonuclease V gamma subunit
VNEAAGSEQPLAPAELKALLGERLQGRPTRANFRTGHLTICTLVPMRSVPHRVVCLLGLDDGAFPRRAPRDGDDLIVADPHVGDRDPRAEDRQMLLDALLAATDRLIVTYTGNDERSNARRPPAVPVGELLDVVGGDVEVRHPLQPFDPRNFEAPEPWGFDPVTLAGARALTREREPARPFLRAPLPALDRRVTELEDLVQFVRHPVRAFLRQRLGVRVAERDEEVQDELHVELDGLRKWEVGNRLLRARLGGVEGRTAVLAEIARGTLPPRLLGKPVVDEVFPKVEDILREAGGVAEPAESVDVRVTLSDGRTLSGTVPDVVGRQLRTVTYSRLAAVHRLTAWVRLLALAAARPDAGFEAVTVGRGEPVAVARIRPLGGAEALAHLEALLDLYARGMCEPLPLYAKTSAAYAQEGSAAARKAWESGWRFEGEDAEPEHRLVLGGVVAFEDLPPAFPACAHALWDPLLACEAT